MPCGRLKELKNMMTLQRHALRSWRQREPQTYAKHDVKGCSNAALVATHRWIMTMRLFRHGIEILLILLGCFAPRYNSRLASLEPSHSIHTLLVAGDGNGTDTKGGCCTRCHVQTSPSKTIIDRPSPNSYWPHTHFNMSPCGRACADIKTMLLGLVVNARLDVNCPDEVSLTNI